MKRLDLDSYFLKVASVVGERSTCSRGETGCVIVKDKIILATGYNGTPSGEPHEPHAHSKTECKAIHAEINAINQAVLVNNLSVRGSTIYITRSPCPDCAATLVAFKIAKVCFTEMHSTFNTSLEILNNAGIMVINKPNFTYEKV